jgi:transcriptional/translational regulatory protein YebC/TACO1
VCLPGLVERTILKLVLCRFLSIPAINHPIMKMIVFLWFYAFIVGCKTMQSFRAVRSAAHMGAFVALTTRHFPVWRAYWSKLEMGRAAVVRADTKAKTDAAKAKNNCYFAKRIIMAVKTSGPNPATNRMLDQLIHESKCANVPKDVVLRNIERASICSTENYKSSLFEFYGYGGVGLLVSTLSDNDKRVAAEVLLVAKRHNLKFAASNSVKFNFVTKAKIQVFELLSDERVVDLCLASEVNEYALHCNQNETHYQHMLAPTIVGESYLYVDPQDMQKLRGTLLGEGIRVGAVTLVSLPLDGFVQINDDDLNHNLLAIAAFESLDDVEKVEHNINLSCV